MNHREHYEYACCLRSPSFHSLCLSSVQFPSHRPIPLFLTRSPFLCSRLLSFCQSIFSTLSYCFFIMHVMHTHTHTHATIIVWNLSKHREDVKFAKNVLTLQVKFLVWSSQSSTYTHSEGPLQTPFSKLESECLIIPSSLLRRCMNFSHWGLCLCLCVGPH